VRRALPPSTTGQPTACAAIVSSSPNALVTGRSAAASSARLPGEQALGFLGAKPPGHDRGRRKAIEAEPGHGQRMPGHGPERGEDLRQGQPHLPDQRAEQPTVGAGVTAEAARVSSTEPATAAARPPSSGWANATLGVHSVTPRAARSMLVKNGEDAASGWTAEHTSCWNPGKVSSAVRQPPPGVPALR